MRVVEAICKLKYFIFCQQKTREMARAPGKLRVTTGNLVLINWSVATLKQGLSGNIIVF